MPIYEYICQGCHDRFEIKQGMNDPPLLSCVKCGQTVTKVISASAIMFKGTGWYVTDYSDKLKQPAETKPDGNPTETQKSDTPAASQPASNSPAAPPKSDSSKSDSSGTTSSGGSGTSTPPAAPVSSSSSS